MMAKKSEILEGEKKVTREGDGTIWTHARVCSYLSCCSEKGVKYSVPVHKPKVSIDFLVYSSSKSCC